MAKCNTDDERKNITDQYNMLVNADKMGERFKLLAIRKHDFKQDVPGFS